MLGRDVLGRDALGREGEAIAARHLERAGYSVIGRRVPTPFGDIDVLASLRDLVVLVEVRTRRASTQALPSPAESIGQRKQRNLRLAAQSVLRRRPELRGRPLRIAVIEVLVGPDTPPTVRHMEDAVGEDGPF